MSRGPFRGTLRLGASECLTAFSAESNQAILTRGDPDPDTVTLIPVTARNADTRWHGTMLDCGTLVLKGTAAPYHNQISRERRVAGLIVPVRLIERAASVLTDGGVDIDLRGWHALRPEPDALARLEAGLEAILDAPPAV